MIDQQEKLRQSLQAFCISNSKLSKEEKVYENVEEFKPSLEDLSALEYICQGPGGTISRARDMRSGRNVTVKSIKLNRRLESRINREIEISTKLKHPQLIETFNVIRKVDTRFVYLVQNYYEGGDLLEFVMSRGPMRLYCPDLARWVVLLVATALSHMESEGIFHGDVKPENLLFETPVHERTEYRNVAVSSTVTSQQLHMVPLPPHPCCSNPEFQKMVERGNIVRSPVPARQHGTLYGSRHLCFPNVRLIDFGHAQHIDPAERTPGSFGTPEYAAPEVFEKAENELVDGPPADVFSLGITLFALLFGSLPWAEPSADNPDYTAFVRRYEDMHPSDVAAGSRGVSPSTRRAAGAVFRDECAERLGITPHLGQLLDGMLCPNPSERMTVAQLLKSPLLFGLPWFTSEEGQRPVSSAEVLSAMPLSPSVSVVG